MVLGLVAMGGSEWVREDLRKPWVIGQYMFVNGSGCPLPDGVPRAAGRRSSRASAPTGSPWTPSTRPACCSTSAWVRPVPDHLLAPDDYAARVEHQGRELFRALCSSCHTIDGYLAIRPLVRGKSPEALDGVLARLASPVDAAGNAAAWNALPVHAEDVAQPPHAAVCRHGRGASAARGVPGAAWRSGPRGARPAGAVRGHRQGLLRRQLRGLPRPGRPGALRPQGPHAGGVLRDDRAAAGHQRDDAGVRRHGRSSGRRLPSISPRFPARRREGGAR